MSCGLSEERMKTEVRIHIKTKRMKKGLRKELARFTHYSHIVEENKTVSYKSQTDSAIQSMQAPPASIVFPV